MIFSPSETDTQMRVFGRILSVVALLIWGATIAADAQNARFTNLVSAYNPVPNTTDYVSVRAQVTDTVSGSTYLWVLYRGSYSIGSFTQPAAGDTLVRTALLRLDAAGTVQWCRVVSTGWNASSLTITLDAAGDVLVLGRSCCAATNEVLDGMPITSDVPGGVQIWLAKWSQFGVIQFARAFAYSPSGDLDGWHLTVGPSGELAMTGNFYRDMVIGGDTLRQTISSTQFDYNGFMASLTPSGGVRWVRAFVHTDTTTLTRPMRVGYDRSGRLYCVGFYSSIGGGAPGAPSFDGQLLPIGRRNFWLQLSPTGNLLRQRTFVRPLVTGSAPRANGVASLVVAPDGASYSAFSLNYQHPVTFEPGRILHPGGDDTFVCRYDPDGSVAWVRQLRGRDTTDHVTTSLTTFALSTNGELLVGGHLQGSLITERGTVGGGGAAGTRLWIAALAAASGEVQWTQATSAGVWSLFNYLTPLTGGAAQLTFTSSNDSLALGSLLFQAPGNFNYKTLLARISPHYNTLTGAAYLDTNLDGIQNPSERGYPGGLVVEVNPGNMPVGVPLATGRYDAYVELGAYTASVPNPPPHHVVVPQGPAAPIAFATYGNVATGRSFALQPIPNQQDVQVLLTHVSAARPGMLVTYHLQYRNVGTVPIGAGTVRVTADGRLALYSSTRPATVNGQVLTWAYTNLLPGQTRSVRVVFRLAATTPLGTVLSSTAVINPLSGDLEPTDNTSVAERTVTGSFDPNDIQVNHVVLNTTQVQRGEWLEYTIRFQNHGTDTAFSVLLTDTLPAALLQMSTLQVLGALHNSSWGFNGSGVVIFRFDDIRLPAQITNPLASDGFVRFRVRPRGSLVVGDLIPNRAAIAFDYNAPLLTNTALTTVFDPLGTAADAASAAALSVWPNPAGGVLHIETASALPRLTLLDATGREVRAIGVPPTGAARVRATLPLSGLAPGLYLLRATGAGAPLTRRVVVR